MTTQPQQTETLEAPKPALRQVSSGVWEIAAPAKINLGLRVFPLRADGFHSLESWFVPISWADTLRFSLDEPFGLTVSGRTEGVPTDPEKNLVGRAAIKLASAGGISPRGKINIHKVVPPGGGLGGGSSDAAHTLIALNVLWNLNLSPVKLCLIAAELGSDVPFFVQGQQSLCSGRGELMTPMISCRSLFAVLVVPQSGLATKPVYQAFDAGYQHRDIPPTSWRHLTNLAAGELNDVLVNDLEPAAFSIAPWLLEIKESATRVAAQRVHMTGSGSTLFTLCQSGAQADELAAKLNRALGGSAFCLPARIFRQTSEALELLNEGQ